jgi:hypothetical protein
MRNSGRTQLVGNKDTEYLALEDGTDRLNRNVGYWKSTLRNLTEERRSHLQRGGRLKSRKKTDHLEDLRVHVRIILKWVYKSTAAFLKCFWSRATF